MNIGESFTFEFQFSMTTHGDETGAAFNYDFCTLHLHWYCTQDGKILLTQQPSQVTHTYPFVFSLGDVVIPGRFEPVAFDSNIVCYIDDSTNSSMTTSYYYPFSLRYGYCLADFLSNNLVQLQNGTNLNTPFYFSNPTTST
jgi:hypothetical protein